MKLAYPFALSTWDGDDPFGNHSSFRKSKGYGPHRGDDWMPGGGARIPASGSGRVRFVEWNNALGWVVVVEYDLYPGVFFGYCHLEDRPPKSVGARFSLGDSLGWVGNTGTASFGAHLHLTASYTLGSPGWVPVINPMQFFGLNTNTAGGGLKPLPKPIVKLKAGTQMMIHWNEPTAILKAGKAGVAHAVTGPRNHFLVFMDTLIVAEFHSDSLSGTQAKANAYSVQCGGPSVLVSKAEFDGIKARLEANRRGK